MPDLALASHLLRPCSDSAAPLPLSTATAAAARGGGSVCEVGWKWAEDGGEGGQLPPTQERARVTRAWGAEPSRLFASATAAIVALRHAVGPAAQLHSKVGHTANRSVAAMWISSYPIYRSSGM